MKKRFWNKKAAAAAMAAVTVMGTLAGCGGSKSAETTAAAADTKAEESKAEETKAAESGSAEGVTIKFRYWADNTDYSQLMQDIIAKFNAENGKGITVVGEEAPGTAVHILRTCSMQRWAAAM